MGLEPERDRFFQYATYVTVGLTILVCACYALVFVNPRVNPILAARPATATPNLNVAELPPTWTPTFTSTPTETPTNTPTWTPSVTPTDTPLPTLTPTSTDTPLPTATPIPATRVPTRRPATRPPPQPTAAPAPSYEFRLGRPVDNFPNCGTWFVSGTVYSDASGSARLNGILVRIWAYGIEQGTDTTGSHGSRTGYWEWIFGQGTAAQGEVALIHPDGSLRSPKIPFTLTQDCGGTGAVQQVVMDFVGGQ